MAVEQRSAPTSASMLRLEEARHRMLSGVEPLPAETVALTEALGRFLATPLDALVTLPPWDNSSMDGFAVRATDVMSATLAEPVRLRVVGEAAAGHLPSGDVGPGTAVRVLTGAIVPRGADAVVPVEETDAPAGVAQRPEVVAIHRPATTGAHIRAAGSDVRAGERLLPAGQRLTPARLALCAAIGHAAVQVHRRPRVAILATGDELVAPGAPLGRAGIPDSNSVGLAAQAAAAGADVVPLGIARDTYDEVRECLRRGAEQADIVICSGGVSVGAHDVVKEAFESVGRLDLWRVAVQPGKPLAFGRAPRRERAGDALLFGLPGNPVSSFVTFELFVRPVLRRLLGDPEPMMRPTVRASLTGPATSAPGRRAFLRVSLRPDPERPTAWLATLCGGQGSHVLSALAQADGLAVMEEEVDALPAGALVEVMVLDDTVPADGLSHAAAGVTR